MQGVSPCLQQTKLRGRDALATIVFLLAANAVFAADPAPEPPKADPAAKADAPLVIDGKLDEPIWQKATPVSVDYIGTKTGTKSETQHMTAKYTWDDRYLYIGYVTFDANLIAVGKDEKQGPPNNQRQGCEIYDAKQDGAKVDVVEFFISFGDEHFMWEIHQNALNQFNDVLCVSVDPSWPVNKTSMATYGIIFAPNEWLADEGEYTVKTAVHLKPKADGKPSTVNDSSDVDTGYTAEIRLPWRSIGAPTAAATWIENKPAPRQPGPWKMAGQTISLLAVMQDGDLKERYHHSSPTRKPDWFHKTQPFWPRYIFTTP
jgi:hypothetical protein